MTDATQTLKILVELQRRDTQLDALSEKRAAVAPQTDGLKKQCSAKRAALDAHRENHKKLLLRGKELERSLSEKEAEIKKHQNELNQVKTNEAFRALQSEIERLKSQAGDAESEILANMDAVSASSAEEKKLAAAFSAEEAKTAALVAEAERAGAEMDVRMSALSSARKEVLGPLEGASLVAKYAHLRSMRGGVAVCEAKASPSGAVCSGCNMRILPHTAVDLKKRGAVVVCDNCQRILYTAETLGEAAPANETAC
ncbi:MAG: C4-type zinc ribbon domain-containing protein [Elusimicrobiales bacterium]